MTTPTVSNYVCRYCRQASDPTAQSCPRCGAPVDVRSAVSDSGWERLPPIRDMARIQFGQSYVQIEGACVPVADFALAGEEWIYFSHHNLLWSDPHARLANMGLGGGWKRKRAGLPVIMVRGSGPGHIGLSDNEAGDLVALPLQGDQRIWVREHRFLAATGNIRYDWVRTHIWFATGTGDDRATHYPLGQYADVFSAAGSPGLLLLHSPGNTFIRDLAAHERLLVQPTSLLYCDAQVKLSLHFEYPHSDRMWFGNRYNYRNLWLRVSGPGRVAVQSLFERPETHERITDNSWATSKTW